MINKIKEELDNLKNEQFKFEQAKNVWDSYIKAAEQLIQEYDKGTCDMEELTDMIEALKRIFVERVSIMNEEHEKITNAFEEESDVSKEHVLNHIKSVREGLALASLMGELATTFSVLMRDRLESTSKEIKKLQEKAEEEGKTIEELFKERFASLSDEDKEKKIQEWDELDDEIFTKYGCTKRIAKKLQEIVGDIPEYEGLI